MTNRRGTKSRRRRPRKKPMEMIIIDEVAEPISAETLAKAEGRREALLKLIPSGTPSGLTDTTIMRALREMQGREDHSPKP